ncbi:MAG TPA: hypothetical protein VEI03_11745 [Stellaceae bacterium]|nr:hypothetical protein [Stellaceae bacterium]
MTAGRHSARTATAEDFAAIRAFSDGGELCRSILEPRFGSLENFLASDDGIKDETLTILLESGGPMAGWACCFRYHERVGYSGVAQFVMDPGADPAREKAAALFGACLAKSTALGMHTIVSMVRAATREDHRWHEERDFQTSGMLEIADGSALVVFTRKLR